MVKGIFISLALLLSIGLVVGWAFEMKYLDGTVGVGSMVMKYATIGAGIGLLIGIVLSFMSKSFIGRFQNMATSILLLSLITPLLAHMSNRLLGAENVEIVELPVKQVTSEYSGRGLNKDAFERAPDAYSIYVEAPEGLIRLRQFEGAAPEIGATRSIAVIRNPGWLGYPMYSLTTTDSDSPLGPAAEEDAESSLN